MILHKARKIDSKEAVTYLVWSMYHSNTGKRIEIKAINDNGEIFTLKNPEEYELFSIKAKEDQQIIAVL